MTDKHLQGSIFPNLEQEARSFSHKNRSTNVKTSENSQKKAKTEELSAK